MGKEKISEKSSLKKSAYKSRKKQQSDASRETALKKNRPLELSKKKNSIKEPPMELSIKEIKELQIEILDYIDKLCRDNTIHYSLAYGTLIGAVRHQGYIPWDDDLDIMMLREDYERFLKVFRESIHPDYISVNYENAWFSWTKICNSRTRIEEDIDYHIKDYGVWVDIFPYDEIPKASSKESKRFRKRLDLMKRMAQYRVLGYKHMRLRGPVSAAAFALAHTAMLPLPVSFWGTMWNRYVKKYAGQNTGYCAFPSIYPHENCVINKEVFDEYTELPFEGKKYMSVRDYDNYLTTIYGDYMQLPPPDQRISRHSYRAYWK